MQRLTLLVVSIVTWGLAPVALAQTVIIDDSDGSPDFTLTGDDWTTWGMLGYGYDSGDVDYHYLSHTVGGADRRGTATWTPNLATAGTWQVETWFRLTENRTTDADHFIYDGVGGTTHVVLNQVGEGASGWIDLGSYWCAAGVGGCVVELDGTDDDQSDEANAVRFTRVVADDPPEPELPPDCSEFAGLGAHTVEAWAGAATGVDWESVAASQGAPDSNEAHTPNVDAGEYLSATGWELCDPIGTETIDAVTVEVSARTQYQSGVYALDLLLDGGGAAQTIFTGTTAAWHSVDITADLAAWTWADAEAVTGTLSLWDHPGGERDSDAWVDAWRIRVDYTTTEGPDDGGDDDDDATAGDDDDVTEDPDPTDDDDATEEEEEEETPEPEEEEPTPDPESLDTGGGSAFGVDDAGCGCDQSVEGASVALLALLLSPGLALRRRRDAPSTTRRRRTRRTPPRS